MRRLAKKVCAREQSDGGISHRFNLSPPPPPHPNTTRLICRHPEST